MDIIVVDTPTWESGSERKMLKPWDENITDISAKEFELFVKKLLEEADENLQGIEIKHDEKIQNYDGTYQIDITARFKVFGSDFLVLIECKHHKNPIKREIVQALHDKVQTIGAQKGMIFSTIGFQKGAIQYASSHGIALIRVAEGKTSYITRSYDSSNNEPPAWANIQRYIGWLIQERGDDSISMSNISEGALDKFINFLHK